MADQLLALSLLQPWLWAILEGHKPVENRPWKPWPAVVGRRIALHASMGWDADGEDFILHTLRFVASPPPPKAQCPRGAILGTAVVSGAIEVGPNQRDRQASFREVGRQHIGPLTEDQVRAAAGSPWSFGPWVWLLQDVRRLVQPIPCKGALGLWRVPADVAARVRELEAA